MQVAKHKGNCHLSKNGFDIIECESCGFIHAFPLPTEDELERIYKNEYYDKDKPLYFKRMEEDRVWWEMTYNERYEKIEEKLGKKGRILDVGSGPGLFLEVGQKRGWECVGLEPSRQAAKYSKDKGLNIIEDFLTTDLVLKMDKFDAIHMSEVLEHIKSPEDFIRNVKHLMNPGGVISITVPNDFNPFQVAFIKTTELDPWWVCPPYHINYFTVKSISDFLNKLGFIGIETETTFPIDLFLLMGDNYIGNDVIGRACHSKRMNFEKNMSKSGMSRVKQDIYKKLSEQGLGREVTATATLTIK